MVCGSLKEVRDCLPTRYERLLLSNKIAHRTNVNSPCNVGRGWLTGRGRVDGTIYNRAFLAYDAADEKKADRGS